LETQWDMVFEHWAQLKPQLEAGQKNQNREMYLRTETYPTFVAPKTKATFDYIHT